MGCFSTIYILIFYPFTIYRFPLCTDIRGNHQFCKKEGKLFSTERQHNMRFLNILLQVGILYIFSFVGTVIQNFFHLVIPGSIIGLLLLFICLCLKIIPSKWIKNGADFLLSILMLFFIPTTVGIMKEPSLFSIHGALFVIAVLLSTIISIAITGTAGQFLEKKSRNRKDDKECSKFSSHSA